MAQTFSVLGCSSQPAAAPSQAAGLRPCPATERLGCTATAAEQRAGCTAVGDIYSLAGLLSAIFNFGKLLYLFKFVMVLAQCYHEGKFNGI